jgi:hypothetical protein
MADNFSKKEWTLVDKHGKHFVFVNWETKEWMTFEMGDGEWTEYEIGKDYNIRLPQ